MEKPKFTFKKSERLCSFKVINSLFAERNSFLVHPFSVIWKEVEHDASEYPAQVVFSVTKKKFRKACQRNNIKRLMREAYRLNKHKLYDNLKDNKKKIAFMVVYVDKNILPYGVVEHKMKKMLNKLNNIINSL